MSLPLRLPPRNKRFHAELLSGRRNIPPAFLLLFWKDWWCLQKCLVIARCAKRAVAIQPLDGLGALSLSKRLDCCVAPLLAMTEGFNTNVP